MKATRVFHVEFKATLSDDALAGSDAKVVRREGDRVVVEVEASDGARAVERVKHALGSAELDGVRVREPGGG
jgi:hypothetical protein